MSCPYSEALGRPREGVHAYRLFDVAVVDVALTILGGLIIAHLLGWHPAVGVAALFVIGVIMHRLFCVKTKVDELLFG